MRNVKKTRLRYAYQTCRACELALGSSLRETGRAASRAARIDCKKRVAALCYYRCSQLLEKQGAFTLGRMTILVGLKVRAEDATENPPLRQIDARTSLLLTLVIITVTVTMSLEIA